MLLGRAWARRDLAPYCAGAKGRGSKGADPWGKTKAVLVLDVHEKHAWFLSLLDPSFLGSSTTHLSQPTWR